MAVDPATLQVFINILSSIAEEMGTVLCRTSFSPNIKERRDFSCAIFTCNGDMIAQASHIPVHLGSMPFSTRAVINALSLDEGDMAILNDPFSGGTHLPDVTMVAPVYHKGKLLFFVANRAHHADIGGASPGSMPLSTDIYQEGLIIPPVKILERGTLKKEIMDIILANVRTPEERKGDLEAQIAANLRGIQRIKEVLDRYGEEHVLECVKEVMDYSERVTRSLISQIPDGKYDFTDYLEDKDQLVPLKVKITVKGDEMNVDFTESAPQVSGFLNAVRSITVSCVLYTVRCLLPEDVPTNQGLMRPIKVITKEGTVVDARKPAALAAGNVETSQRIVDVIFGALSQAIPDRIPAASQGTMNNLLIGNSEVPFVYYETIAGGAGACPEQDGESAIHTHMTNTMNTPIEALEFSYPLMVTSYKIRKGSGGKGKRKGGDGIIRSVKLLEKAHVTVISQRRRTSPFGLAGGENGKKGRNIIVINGQERDVGPFFSQELPAGAEVRIETPGGGGYGKPQE